jgi:hypothetical protein
MLCAIRLLGSEFRTAGRVYSEPKGAAGRPSVL